MNKALLNNPYEYPKVVMWWKEDGHETELTLKNRTLAEAYKMALAAGYKPPVWYKPWQYFTGGLGVVTVG